MYEMWDKRLLYLSTFFAPFYFFIPTNFGIYEIILLGVGLLYLLSGKKIIFFDKNITLAFILIIFGYTLSIINAINIIEATKFPIQFIFILCVQSILLISLTNTKKDLWWHSFAATLALLLISTISLGYYFRFFSGVRYSFVYHNPNTFAHILYFLIVACSAILFDHIRKKKITLLTVIAITSIFSGSINIILTQSRATIGVLFVFLISMTILRTSTNMTLYKFTRNTIISLIFGSALLVVIVTSGNFPSSVAERFARVLDIQSSTVRSRIVPIRVSIRYNIDNLFLGAGYNNYELNVPSYALTEEELRYQIRPHNFVLSTFSEGGISSAIGSFGLLVLYTSRFVRKTIRSLNNNFSFGFSYPLGVLGYFAAKQFGIFSVLRIYWLFIILGLIYFYIDD